jgi:adenine-specific DNA-methyltransferase
MYFKAPWLGRLKMLDRSAVRIIYQIKKFGKSCKPENYLLTFLYDILIDRFPIINEFINRNEIYHKYRKLKGYQEFLQLLLPNDPLEIAYHVSTLYSYLVESERRITNGMFFTPPILSQILLNEVERCYRGNMLDAQFADLCSGGGAFLAPLARRLRVKLYTLKIKPAEIIQHISWALTGIDIDPFLNRITRIFLAVELYEEIKKSDLLPNIELQHLDVLKEFEPRQHFNIIVGNPPFRKLSKTEHSEFKRNFTRVISGASNLYALFIDKSLDAVDNGGIVSLIVPVSMFGGRYFQRLRSRIAEAARVKSVYWMESRDGMFQNVLQEAAILTMLRAQRKLKKSPKVRMLLLDREYNKRKIGLVKIHGSSSWILPKSEEQVRLLETYGNGLPTITDYGYEIHTGYLVWNRSKLKRLKRFPKNGEKKPIYPLIWSTCVTGDGVFDPLRLPDGENKGGFVYFNQNVGLHRQPGVLVKRTSSSDMSRRLRCAPIPADFIDKWRGYVCENHVYVLTPKPGVHTSISPELLSIILNSRLVDEAFRCMSGTVAVSKYELKQLPLPDPTTVAALLAKGLSVDNAVAVGYFGEKDHAQI